ncbi:MAG: hypothetical protein KDC98_10740 [Planctomycetes bacterium]|nr:hypothetical protein [Planctomycetota bacterium]
MQSSTLTALVSALLVSPALTAQGPTYHAALEPVHDTALAALPGGVALSLPGLFTDLVISGGGQFVELPNGSARLTGRVFSQSSLYSAFLIDLQFANKVAPGAPNHPPASGPDLQLQTTAYMPTGPIDPGTFTYYTQVTGTLTGVRNLDGAVLSLTATGSGAQLGLGANNQNGTLGLAATFQVTVLQQPAAPLPPLTTAALTLDLPSHRTDKATHPQVDSTRSTLPAGRAMVLPGVASDYLFVPAGDFTEYDDGHAELSGTFARLSQLDDAWDVTLLLSNRIDPGEANYPPVGSPVLQMLPSAYVGQGGTLDPAHWHYYQTATGTLTGQGINAGGSIDLTNTGAVQYGGGANQTNTYYGYYGAFGTSVTSQPSGRTIVITADAELFGLCATFPVLPFPTLTAPAVTHTLPTLTDQGLIVQGDNLAWIDLVGVDWDLLGRGDANRWFAGWFRVIDNQTIEVHPRPGAIPNTYALSVFNPAVRSNVIPLALTAPTTPVLYSEPAVAAFETAHLHVHQGAIPGPALSAIVMSQSLLPTVLPGIVTLGIGNQQTQLLMAPGSFLHDPTTGIARFDFGPIPPWFSGFVMHMQAVTIDLTTPTLPLPTTNIWDVTF